MTDVRQVADLVGCSRGVMCYRLVVLHHNLLAVFDSGVTWSFPSSWINAVGTLHCRKKRQLWGHNVLHLGYRLLRDVVLYYWWRLPPQGICCDLSMARR